MFGYIFAKGAGFQPVIESTYYTGYGITQTGNIWYEHVCNRVTQTLELLLSVNYGLVDCVQRGIMFLGVPHFSGTGF